MSARHVSMALVLTALAASTQAQTAPYAQLRAVVEVFTSQSCSACPPALWLAANLSQDPGLLVLSLPVAYWDYLGWKDTLARPAFTARQRAYASVRADRQVFTPEMVINGRKSSIGSDAAQVLRTIEKATNGGEALPVEVRSSQDGEMLLIDVGAGHGEAGLWLLTVRRFQEVAILRGENKGARLPYVNAVREIHNVGTWSGTPARYRVPARLLRTGDADGYVVLLQQATPSGAPGPILGGAKGTSR